jgi:hypothetical protein
MDNGWCAGDQTGTVVDDSLVKSDLTIPQISCRGNKKPNTFRLMVQNNTPIHTESNENTRSCKIGRSWKTVTKQKKEISLHRDQQQESYIEGGEFAIKGTSEGMPAYIRTANKQRQIAPADANADNAANAANAAITDTERTVSTLFLQMSIGIVSEIQSLFSRTFPTNVDRYCIGPITEWKGRQKNGKSSFSRKTFSKAWLLYPHG